jgi:hypothetical protein
MRAWLLLLPLAACSSEPKPTDAAPLDSGGDSDVACTAEVTAITPADGASDVDTNTEIVATFSAAGFDADITIVPEVAGTVTLAADSLSATFVADGGLADATDYVVTASACGDTSSAGFTTAGVPLAVDLTGHTYDIELDDPTDLVWVAPSFGELLVDRLELLDGRHRGHRDVLDRAKAVVDERVPQLARLEQEVEVPREMPALRGDLTHGACETAAVAIARLVEDASQLAIDAVVRALEAVDPLAVVVGGVSVGAGFGRHRRVLAAGRVSRSFAVVAAAATTTAASAENQRIQAEFPCASEGDPKRERGHRDEADHRRAFGDVRRPKRAPIGGPEDLHAEQSDRPERDSACPHAAKEADEQQSCADQLEHGHDPGRDVRLGHALGVEVEGELVQCPRLEIAAAVGRLRGFEVHERAAGTVGERRRHAEFAEANGLRPCEHLRIHRVMPARRQERQKQQDPREKRHGVRGEVGEFLHRASLIRGFGRGSRTLRSGWIG